MRLHPCVCVCKNMIQLLIDAFVSVPMPMCLCMFSSFEGSSKLNIHLQINVYI